MNILYYRIEANSLSHRSPRTRRTRERLARNLPRRVPRADFCKQRGTLVKVATVKNAAIGTNRSKVRNVFRKQMLYLVSEECCSLRRLLKPSERKAACGQRSRPARSPPKRTEAGVRRNAVRSEDFLGGAKATCGQHQPPTRSRPKRTDDRTNSASLEAR